MNIDTMKKKKPSNLDSMLTETLGETLKSAMGHVAPDGRVKRSAMGKWTARCERMMKETDPEIVAAFRLLGEQASLVYGAEGEQLLPNPVTAFCLPMCNF